MPWLEDIFKGGAEGIFSGVSGIIKNFKADPLELARLEQAIEQAKMQTAVQLSQAQTRINEIEAASTDKFTSRWRPFIGWVCGSAFAYTFVLQPFLVFVLVAGGIEINVAKLPILDWTTMMPILFGMLGLGYLRTEEKKAGVQDKH